MAFFHTMIAHAAFERRLSELMSIIADDEQLADKRLPDAKDRPKEMRELIGKHHPNGLVQTDDIANYLGRSITFCHDRNLLAHGAGGGLINQASPSAQIATGPIRNGMRRSPPLKSN